MGSFILASLCNKKRHPKKNYASELSLQTTRPAVCPTPPPKIVAPSPTCACPSVQCQCSREVIETSGMFEKDTWACLYLKPQGKQPFENDNPPPTETNLSENATLNAQKLVDIEGRQPESPHWRHPNLMAQFLLDWAAGFRCDAPGSLRSNSLTPRLANVPYPKNGWLSSQLPCKAV